MNLDWPVVLAMAVVITALISGLVTYAIMAQRNRELGEKLARLQAELEGEHRLSEEREAAFLEARESLSDHFAALSGNALQNNNQLFLKLAEQALKQQHMRAQNDLEQREKSIDAMVTPIRDALRKTEEQIHQIEKERREAYGSLSRHLESMAQTQSQLHGETRNLVQALRRPEVRGQWGELTLRRLVELAGMVEHCDFVEQPHVSTSEGDIRPDLLVSLPENRIIVVDAKAPLDAYLSAVEADSDEQRRTFLQAHLRNVQNRIRELADKNYWAQFERSPEFVVLFIPGEQFLGAALDLHPKLQEEALVAKIVLATPNNFVALLKTIAFGWRQQSVAENSEQIRLLGEELHSRLATFFDHLLRTGRALNSVVDSFNRSVGSLERQVLPGARRFGELGIQSKKTLQAPKTLEAVAREPNPGDEELT